MQGASTATAEIMVFRFIAEITILIVIQTELIKTENAELVTHNAAATNRFKAEVTIARISEV